MGKETQLIINLSARTDKLEKAIKRANAKMNGFKRSMNGIGASIRSSMLLAFGGAAIIGGIKNVIGKLAAFETAMKKIQAISGADFMQLKALEANALQLGKTTRFTATEIAGLQLALSKLGFDPSQILASTEAIQQLAIVTGEDLAESARIMAGTLNSFNLEAGESGRVANLMAESFSKSALTLEKFGVSMANSGAIANVMGVSLEKNTARVAKLVDANIDASKAGTDLRMIMLRLNEAGISYSLALEMIRRSSDKAATAQKLVGVRAAGALVILTKQSKKVDELEDKFLDSNKEIKKMAEIISSDLSTAWLKLTSAMDGAILKLKNSNGIMKKFVDFISSSINGISMSELETKLDFLKNTFKGTFDEIIKTPNLLPALLESIEDRLKAINTTLDAQTAPAFSGGPARKGLEETIALSKLYSEQLAKVQKHIEDITAATERERLAIIARNKEIAEAIRFMDAFKGIDAVSLAAPDLKGGEISFGITSEMIDDHTVKIGHSMERYILRFRTFGQDMLDISQMLNTTISNSLTGVFESIGSAIGGGGDSMSDGFDKFKLIMAAGMQQIGAAMIAYGVAKLAFDKSIISNPIAAIVAGGIMVAAGAALKARTQSFSDSAGGGGGGGSSRSFRGDRTGQSVQRIEGEVRIAGTDMVLLLTNQQRADDRNRG